MSPLHRFLYLWRQLFPFEQELVIVLMRLTFHRRALLPALGWQAGLLGVVMLVAPDEILLLALVSIVSIVYVLMLRVWARRYI